ncbi:helix-turn-helix domain-containing protein [Sorangium sp. So ce1128]
MHVVERAPGEALRPYVDRFWGLRSAPGEVVALADLLPGTGAELMIHLGAPLHRADGGALPESQLVCLRASTLALAPHNGGLDVLCVRFRAGAVRHFLDASVTDAADANAALDDLAAPPARDLRDRLADLGDFADRVALVERSLLALRARCARPDVHADRAVARIYASSGRVRVAPLARELGVVPRHLARRFRAAVGVSPKQFARLVRFQHTVRALVLAPGADLTRVAAAHGYCDQAHFAHEFRALAGQPATAFLRHASIRSHFYKPSAPR